MRFVALLVLVFVPSVALARPGVNSVLGDDSYVARFGAPPDSGVAEDVRLRVHLEYAEALLRTADTSTLDAAHRATRARNLDLLHAYHQAGVFPRNHDVPGRRPHFIDEAGRICAVGYLVEQTAGRDIAEAINHDFEWAFVPDIHGAAFDAWVEHSGLTVRELAMIQPSYDWEIDDQNKTEVERRMARVPELLLGVAPQVQTCADRIGLSSKITQVPITVTLLRNAARIEVPSIGSAAFRACVKRIVEVRVAGMYLTQTRKLEIPFTFTVKGGSAGVPVDRAEIEHLLRARLEMFGSCLDPKRTGEPPSRLRLRVTVDPSGAFASAKVLEPTKGPADRNTCILAALAAMSPSPFAGGATDLVFELGSLD